MVFFPTAHCFGAPQAAPQRPDSMRALDEVSSAMSGTGAEPLKAPDVKAQADGGHTLARLAYGLMLMEGQAGVKQDMQSAADYLRPACAAKNANACFFLGLMHDGLVGVDGRGLPRRPAEAGRLYRSACDLGVAQGCFNFAQILDRPPHEPRQLPGTPAPPPAAGSEKSDKEKHKEEKRVAKFFAMACSGGVGKGCVNLGVMHLDGYGGFTPSPLSALPVLQRACQMQEGTGCQFAGDLMMQGLVPGNQSHAAELYYAGCRFGSPDACLAQGRMLGKTAKEAVDAGQASGEAVLQAKARSVMFFRRACELGSAKGCQIFYKSNDGVKVIDARSEDEKDWLSVTPTIDGTPRAPAA